ncbi:GNAT family N-acetyltransferase [Wenjunlia tyrosinilytica]|uniref:N-acetyltransferase domain-containing protein n=1 Tax=Wenjunlia tyrosinilytica TaxID=1544741 RepID=A0A917ZK71_9ACTN|nr:GNAT family N-acetyltransferase [Wenjunlia tyrosinilytica]GGO83484.1 hypothetical protein GCM10012280_12590 [Wenjunlia tyrosinilytica]
MPNTALSSRVPAVGVHAALAAAWQAEGTLREPYGGGAATLPGVRVMASGLPDARWWNNGDVERPDFDLDAVRAWYEGRADEWGLRVPAGMEWRHGGTKLTRQRCMGLFPEAFRPAPRTDAVTIRRAGPEDVEAFAHVDATAFGDPPQRTRSWCEPQLTSGDPRFHLVLAEIDGDPIGVATAVRTGESVAVFGVGVLEEARRRGIGSALTSVLVAEAFHDGARLSVLNPDTRAAARLYAGLGFVESGGLDIYVAL